MKEISSFLTLSCWNNDCKILLNRCRFGIAIDREGNRTRLLRTSSEIRKALGNYYKLLVNKYDIKSRERRATYREAKELKPELCAACGKKPPEVFRLEAAHISPLAECSTTHRRNLLLLCREQKGSRELGCHALFDQGYCSIREMINCRKDWIANKAAILRSLMLKLKNQYGPQLQLQGHLR